MKRSHPWMGGEAAGGLAHGADSRAARPPPTKSMRPSNEGATETDDSRIIVSPSSVPSSSSSSSANTAVATDPSAALRALAAAADSSSSSGSHAATNNHNNNNRPSPLAPAAGASTQDLLAQLQQLVNLNQMLSTRAVAALPCQWTTSANLLGALQAQQLRQQLGLIQPLALPVAMMAQPNILLPTGNATAVLADASQLQQLLKPPEPVTNATALAQLQRPSPPLSSLATASHNTTTTSSDTRLPCVLSQPEDSAKLNAHQVLLRNQIEAFAAAEDDVSTHTRGRNKPIALGQVGIRCRHCAHLPVSRRQKGSTYFPATTMGLYQAAQNMSTTHMQCGLCSEMPAHIKNEFVRLLSTKHTSSGAGRPYWAASAKRLGLYDTEDGIRCSE